MIHRNGQSASFAELGLRLLADVGRLVDQRLALLKAELARDAVALARTAGLLTVGALAASVGLAFLLLGVGLWVGELVGSAPEGFALVGAGLGILGVGAGALAVRRLQHQRLAEETRRELRKDAEWIRHGA